MKCNVIQDLLPLYIDDCCSEESRQIVEEHLKSCSQCERDHGLMNKALMVDKSVPAPKMKLRRVSDWKASLLQSVMFFLTLTMMIAGIFLENSTPEGSQNGVWAMAFIIPATGNLISLANWYFIRVYPGRKVFSWASCLLTVGATLGMYVWAFLHYTSGIVLSSPLVITGVAVSLVFCVASKILSNQYALYLGRE